MNQRLRQTGLERKQTIGLDWRRRRLSLPGSVLVWRSHEHLPWVWLAVVIRRQQQHRRHLRRRRRHCHCRRFASRAEQARCKCLRWLVCSRHSDEAFAPVRASCATKPITTHSWLTIASNGFVNGNLTFAFFFFFCSIAVRTRASVWVCAFFLSLCTIFSASMCHDITRSTFARRCDWKVSWKLSVASIARSRPTWRCIGSFTSRRRISRRSPSQRTPRWQLRTMNDNSTHRMPRCKRFRNRFRFLFCLFFACYLFANLYFRCARTPQKLYLASLRKSLLHLSLKGNLLKTLQPMFAQWKVLQVSNEHDVFGFVSHDEEKKPFLTRNLSFSFVADFGPQRKRTIIVATVDWRFEIITNINTWFEW